MRDEAGYLVFASLRVPSYTLLLWRLFADDGVNRRLTVGLGVFFLVHFLLGMIFVNHPEYRFRSTFSRAPILGAGSPAR